MIGHSLPAYIAIRVAGWCMHAITPALIGGALLKYYYTGHIHVAWEVWAVCEVGFFGWYSYIKYASQKRHPKPPIPTLEQRRNIFQHILNQVDSDAQSTSWLSHWFRGASPQAIYHDNLLEWILWALFQTTPERVPRQSKLLDEANDYIQELEKKWNIHFHEGYNKRVKSIRLSEDPVLMHHHPLLFYAAVAALDLKVHIQLRYYNFSHQRANLPDYRPIFPPSLSHFSKNSCCSLSYWYKPPSSSVTSLKPIVLSHGIGIGVHSYLALLTELAKTHPDVPIFCIENLPVSMRVVKDVPTKEEVCDGIREMLQREGYDQALFVGHSIGNVTLSYLIHQAPTLIAGLIFLDPINFLLHLPHVAHNFLYREPRRANEWMIYTFVAREAGIAWSLWRNFFWFEGILWKHEIEPWKGKTVVMLAGEDLIVPADEVWSYLTDNAPLDNEKRRKGEGKAALRQEVTRNGIEVIRYPHLDHGAMMFQKSVTEELCGKISKMCSTT